MVRLAAGQQRRELRAQRFGRLEAAVGLQVELEEAVQGAGDVAGRVELGLADVDDADIGVGQPGLQLLGRQQGLGGQGQQRAARGAGQGNRPP